MWLLLAAVSFAVLAYPLLANRAFGEEDAGPPVAPAASGSAAASGSRDGAEARTEDSGPPTEVYVGIYLNQIRSVSLSENSFTVDFWLWFRWKKGGRDIDPLATFEVIGGDIDKKSSEVHEDLGEWNYAACRVVATILEFFDVRSFPRDSHDISIVIEDSKNEDHKVVFVADKENTTLDPDVRVPGFVVTGTAVTVGSHSYRSNYGDISLPVGNESRYARFELRTSLSRPGFGYTVKLAWGLWLATLIALVAMFIKPTEVDPRFGLGVGAIFAAMANEYIINSVLPESNLLTNADLVGMTTITFIFISIVQSAYSLRLCQQERKELSSKLDRYSFFVLLGLYVLINVIVLT
jgi:hypothetical protein